MDMPLKETDRFTIRMRNEDGNNYWTGNYWSSEKSDAIELTWEEACKIQDEKQPADRINGSIYID